MQVQKNIITNVFLGAVQEEHIVLHVPAVAAVSIVLVGVLVEYVKSQKLIQNLITLPRKVPPVIILLFRINVKQLQKRVLDVPGRLVLMVIVGSMAVNRF